MKLNVIKVPLYVSTCRLESRRANDNIACTQTSKSLISLLRNI